MLLVQTFGRLFHEIICPLKVLLGSGTISRVSRDIPFFVWRNA